MKKNSLIALIATGLATLGGAILYLNNKIRFVDVPVGEYRISGNTLSSDGFSVCSGVILDYGDGAIMAHAPPSVMARYIPIGVNTRNVVSTLNRELRNKHIDPTECQAIVNAGTVESLYRIKKDLAEIGVSIREEALEKEARNLIYNPKTNELIINYISR